LNKKETPMPAISQKKEKTENMFDGIAGHYDFLNHFLSAGIDIIWRKKAINKIKPCHPKKILDIATGTADLAIEASSFPSVEITGLDLSEKMLEIGKKKIEKKKLQNTLKLQKGDAENLPFEDNSFDAVMVAFGVRNFENLKKGLSEMNRVLKPNGTLMILEFSKPSKFPIKQVYNLYFNSILPGLGKIISNHNSAYRYLPDTVARFPDGNKFLEILNDTGYKNCNHSPLTMGIASIYTGTK
jgi:demethylmenaquinone methyltransferase/2-methoxy-6-polyprenyl-1,4-benzoquinol methylase